MTTPGDTREKASQRRGREAGAGSTPGPSDPLAPPRLLTRPAAPPPVPPPLAQSEPIAQLHRRWSQLHGAPGSAALPAPAVPDPGRGAAPAAPRIPGGVRAKVRARVATAAAGVQQADRAMTGDLVRAVDAIAHRLDELSTRVSDLEALLQEVVDTVSEDLVRLQVALGVPPEGTAEPEPPR